MIDSMQRVAVDIHTPTVLHKVVHKVGRAIHTQGIYVTDCYGHWLMYVFVCVYVLM